VTNKLTPRKLEALYAAIGRFVIVWADLELILDLLVLTLRNLQDPLHRKPTIPHSLGKKLSFVRSIAQTLPSVRSHLAEIASLLDEIGSLADTRHDYVHGAVVGHSLERSAIRVTMGRMLQPVNRPRRKTVKVTAAEIARTADHIYNLGGRLLDLVAELNSLARSVQSDDPFRYH